MLLMNANCVSLYQIPSCIVTKLWTHVLASMERGNNALKMPFASHYIVRPEFDDNTQPCG
jgi:hypothetical protein